MDTPYAVTIDKTDYRDKVLEGILILRNFGVGEILGEHDIIYCFNPAYENLPDEAKAALNELGWRYRDYVWQHTT